MKFLRRESERDTFEARPPSSSKRAMDSNGGSQAMIPTTVPAPSKPEAPPSITMQTPDNVIGETLVVQGRVEFSNLLRIDGHFEGELIGTGSLIIGPTAEVISNLRGLAEVYVEGILIGDCVCEKMQIRFAGCVTGNIQCASLGMDPSVVLKDCSVKESSWRSVRRAPSWCRTAIRSTISKKPPQGSANVNPRDRSDKGDRSKSRGNPPRHSRQRSQPRLSTEETSSARTSHASTSALSPDSEDDSVSVLGDDPKLSVTFDENGGKTGRSHSKQKSNRSRSNGSGSTASASSADVAGAGGHNRNPSSESSTSSIAPAGSSEGDKVIVPRLGDALSMPARNRPPTYQTKSGPSVNG